jgi:hypothetical protein
MKLWQTNSYEESSESDNDVLRTDSEDLVDFFSPVSTRETEKALRRETNSPFVEIKAKLTTRLNRIKSIYHDSKFVQTIALQFPNLPIVGKFPQFKSD